MNGFYSHFPHIAPLWKLAEETLSVGLSELRQFTQIFYRAKSEILFLADIWGAPHPAPLVGRGDFLHPFYILLWRVRKSLHNYSHLLGKAKIYCGKLCWDFLEPPIGAVWRRTRELSKKVQSLIVVGHSSASLVYPSEALLFKYDRPLNSLLNESMLINGCRGVVKYIWF